MRIFRKMFLMGIGVMSLTREKGEQLFNELVERGEMSKDEARSFVNDAVERGEEERKATRSFIKEELEKIKGELPFISRAEFEDSKKRVADLENGAETEDTADAKEA